MYKGQGFQAKRKAAQMFKRLPPTVDFLVMVALAWGVSFVLPFVLPSFPEILVLLAAFLTLLCIFIVAVRSDRIFSHDGGDKILKRKISYMDYWKDFFERSYLSGVWGFLVGVFLMCVFMCVLFLGRVFFGPEDVYVFRVLIPFVRWENFSDALVFPSVASGVIAAFFAFFVSLYFCLRQIERDRAKVPTAWRIHNVGVFGILIGGGAFSTFISFFSVNDFGVIVEGEMRGIFSDAGGYFIFFTSFIVLVLCQALLAQDYLQRVLDAVEKEREGGAAA